MTTKLSQTLFLILVLCVGLAQAAEVYKPYFLGDVAPVEVKEKLIAKGFEIVGEYDPHKYDPHKEEGGGGAKIIVVTNEALKNAAAQTEKGGFGAIQRVAITTIDDKTEVSYTNPTYMAHLYRLAVDLAEVTTSLKEALGHQGNFGSEKGMTKEELREYHYMIGMPYFTDPVELTTHESYAKAVETIEAGLKAGKGDTQFVYRVDIPNKEETVFGMGVIDGNGSDETVMNTLNMKRNAAYMPYEILVSGNKSYILHGRFRIAISFPDLGMGTFMKIVRAPGAIEEAARKVTTVEKPAQ